ncbi:HAMP domain-containing sensor histidine kinase [Ideonella sp. DXS22W]|uniref:histidine kinase n=1 Tax=Pseudaquabacterium inlustre TaxID=2984192 RepID=A0ABU9CM18_9BURK
MSRQPGGLFWKVFAACWFTALLTGLGINVFARLFPALIDLPPTPPRVSQSVLMPMLTGGLMAALISALLAWSLSRPIRLLRQAFGAAAAGQLALRVAPRLGRQRDEFAELARDYDRMAQRLQDLLGAQRRLLHDVSHELRSPLARLQVASALLQRDGLQRTDAAGQTALRRIDREVERLDQLVGEVLTLARLESGTPLGRPCEIDVVALLASVADDARFEARIQGRELDFAGPQQPVLTTGHGELLLRAFDNLLRNAVRFTAPGSRVAVSAELQPHGAHPALRVCVADRGPGLPPAALQRVFEPFVRGDEAAPGVPPGQGFGLGLAIARRAVQAHGGELTATNRDGGGLVMTLVLPLTAELNQL